jgi:uncharacterized metal-binding protein
MKKRKGSKHVVVVALLDTDSHFGRLCLRAAKELEQTGFCRVTEIDRIISERKQGKKRKTERILVVDGTDNRGYSFLEQHGITPDHHLVAADLGIEEDDGEEVLQLLKDGMEAECALVDNLVPAFPCPCCSSLK